LLEDRDLDFPAKLLDALTFLPDSHIQDCFSTIAADFLDRPTTFIVPLGEPSESSFRLSAAYHRHPGFRTSLAGALDEILAAEVQPTILFFDDFLNSGGQLTSIMHSWLGVPLPPGAIADEGDKRTRLS